MRKSVLILGHNYGTQFIDVYNQYTRLFDPEHFEVTVAYLTGPANLEVKERTLAERVIFFDMPKGSLRYLKLNAIKTLLNLCQKKKFQIVICHRYKPTYIMLWVTQFFRVDALVSVMHELGTMRSIKRKLLIASLAKKNVLFAGVSNAVTNDLQKSLWRIPREKIITLYNMIDVDLTTPLYLERKEARRALGLPEDGFIFGNLARLAPNKDQTTLIEAFYHLHKKSPNVKLVIMGDGILEIALKKQVIEKQLQDAVIFTGFVSQGFRYMRAFDCFVLSSIQEAFGRVLLEAMLASVPVIATTVHGIPEVMGSCGALIQPKAPIELTQAMQQMYAMSSAERISLGQQGHQRVNNHFSIPQFQEQFWQIPLIKRIRDY